MKTLIMLSAVPASGKSTWAANYKSTHPNTYIVSSDEVRMEVCNGDFQDHSRQPEVWALFEKRIKEYANKDENVTVILDALCDLNSLRIKYVKENPEYNKYVLVVFPRTFEYVQKFNKMRDQEVWVPDDILRQLYDKYEKPSAEALGYFNEVLIVKEDD